MITFDKKTIEEIHVFHNSLKEMNENVSKLVEKGWSHNTRISNSGMYLTKFRIVDVDNFKQRHPEITIHSDVGRNVKYELYVYYTIHQREARTW
ncbi:hypothetical protein [Metabacillus fastidiosus]|uniref:hypothetical protein n=1 Tax=Metabacillus fastidiosus TaxID=1458 RepID=UPI003D2B058F